MYTVIELAERAKMPSNLVDCPIDKVHIGLPVELAFIERDGKTLPVFKMSEVSTTPLTF
ncbi:MAG: OB-fold domain-containing protein [Syntrophomonas sp.]|nr:OB-fold domain-containing protein [Syntrophomonas sp.]